MAKKTTKKTSKKTVNKDIDINDVASIMNDMKDLSLHKPEKEDAVKTVSPQPKEEFTLGEVIEEQDLTFDETPKEMQESEDKNEETPTVEMSDDEIKETIDELSFIEEIKENGIKEEEKIIDKEEQTLKKKRRITYEEMFGTTWCGYGYTEK